MKEISLLKLKPTKQLWNLNPSMKELFYTLEFRRRAPVDSLLAIIGDEGEDVTALIAAKSEPKESESAKSENKRLQLHQKQQRRKTTSTAPATLPEGVVIVTMPRLSDTMTEGTVATWLNKVVIKLKKVTSS
jgi:pyruvate dehydrogenase E2 component (dihydrolipoamide acetyltransferase)